MFGISVVFVYQNRQSNRLHKTKTITSKNKWRIYTGLKCSDKWLNSGDDSIRCNMLSTIDNGASEAAERAVKEALSPFPLLASGNYHPITV